MDVPAADQTWENSSADDDLDVANDTDSGHTAVDGIAGSITKLKTDLIDAIFRVFDEESWHERSEADLNGVVVPSIKGLDLDVLNRHMRPQRYVSTRSYISNQRRGTLRTVPAIQTIDEPLVLMEKSPTSPLWSLCIEMIDVDNSIVIENFEELANGISDVAVDAALALISRVGIEATYLKLLEIKAIENLHEGPMCFDVAITAVSMNPRLDAIKLSLWPESQLNAPNVSQGSVDILRSLGRLPAPVRSPFYYEF